MPCSCSAAASADLLKPGLRLSGSSRTSMTWGTRAARRSAASPSTVRPSYPIVQIGTPPGGTRRSGARRPSRRDGAGADLRGKQASLRGQVQGLGAAGGRGLDELAHVVVGRLAVLE